MHCKNNKDLFKQAKKYIAGGVNSPVRSFGAVGGYPVFIKKAKGAKIYSEDGRHFIDYCLAWGALILGHSYPGLVNQLKKAADGGINFGTPTRQETELAKLIVQALPSIEKLRLTNSGTEAVMSAVRLARAFTKRDKVIKFSGAYHGHIDYLLDSAGVPQDFKKHTITLPYNDIKKIEETAKKQHKIIAAIIVEPVAANIGVVLPDADFLPGLRKIADKYGIILIFDEVITAFRLAYGGAQGRFKIKPDLTCLGKTVAGGLPFGAYGGREEIMKLVAPQGRVYQAGTFSGNPLVVKTAIATLKTLKGLNPYASLEKNTQGLCEEIQFLARKHRLEVKVNYIASLFSFSFGDREVFKKFFHGLLKQGVYLSPSPTESNFLSLQHRQQELTETLRGIDKVFKELKGA